MSLVGLITGSYKNVLVVDKETNFITIIEGSKTTNAEHNIPLCKQTIHLWYTNPNGYTRR